MTISTAISPVSGGIFDKLQDEVRTLESKASVETLWNNPQEAEKLLAELKRKQNNLSSWKSLEFDVQGLNDLFALIDADDELVEDLAGDLSHAMRSYEKLRIIEFLSGEHDLNSAFLTVHSGAGGQDASDWTAMLLRMYLRWAERRGFRSEVVDMVEDEGGVRVATVLVKGDHAFGYLKGESGIHRLVRISPFDSNHRRHTSFASVTVLPEVDDSIDIDIAPADIRVDTYRASGAGGQHVNKTDSAVRITHLETNIVVQCQNERSQHKNRAMAMKMLKSRLYEHFAQLRDEEEKKRHSEQKDISWGNQIRSYVFHPYTMVKDHRTNVQAGNVQACVDGDIDAFIEAYLQFSWQSTS